MRKNRAEMGRDHPRIRGEKIEAGIAEADTQGSPPHTRGKVAAVQLPHLAAGITPAYAGKRPPPSLRQAMRKDHPRIRGEKHG